MSLQHDRIAELCEQLKFARLGSCWPALAQDAAREEASFAEFLEKILASELVAREERRRTTMLRLATMPSIKMLEHFDWSQATGAPKAQIMELGHLAFVERAENVVLLGPGEAATYCPRTARRACLHSLPLSPARRCRGRGDRSVAFGCG